MATERKVTSTNYRNQSFLEEKCSLNELLDLVSKRWICEVLFCIEEGINRFKSVKEELSYISDTILADRFRLLEKYDLVSKEHFDEIPFRVEYTLTEKGQELCTLLEQICNFSDSLPACKIESKKKTTSG
ncbi:helix-turn-helix domain-containing protein [Chitinophagaceae bacterium 26-R-25]|nr:helix-turn-helix domain-containing protein [Chitinophagaceae bacterium 26-R-25]